MANYITSAYKMPKRTIKSLVGLQSSFWWGKKTNKFCWLIAWDKICQPKPFGGLGIRNPSIMNQALHSKVARRITSNLNSLLSLILKAKYEKNKASEHVTNCKDPSYQWRSIMKGIEYIRNDVCL